MTFNWKLKDKATGLNHHVRTTLGPNTAISLCRRSLTVNWEKVVEMPPCAVITCLECLVVEARIAAL